MCENDRIETYRPKCKEIRIRSTLVRTWGNLFESRSKKHYSFGKSVMLFHLYLELELFLTNTNDIFFFMNNTNEILCIKENDPFFFVFFVEKDNRLLQIHDWTIISIIKD